MESQLHVVCWKLCVKNDIGMHFVLTPTWILITPLALSWTHSKRQGYERERETVKTTYITKHRLVMEPINSKQRRQHSHQGRAEDETKKMFYTTTITTTHQKLLLFYSLFPCFICVFLDLKIFFYPFSFIQVSRIRPNHKPDTSSGSAIKVCLNSNTCLKCQLFCM